MNFVSYTTFDCSSQLRQDHEKMKEMYFGEVPKFDKVMNGVKDIESKINQK